jgi:hypothetical protein
MILTPDPEITVLLFVALIAADLGRLRVFDDLGEKGNINYLLRG